MTEIEVIETTVELVIPPAVVMEMEVPQGVPGQSVEMRYSGGYIQWRRLGDATWNNLVALTWSDISGKPTEFPPEAHGHPIEEIEGLSDALDALGTALGGKLNTADFTWANLSGKPTTFTPSSHTHAISDVSGLTDALSAKLETSEVVNTPTASKVPRTSALGWLDAFLSSAIARLSDLTWTNIAGKPSTFAPSAHSHTTADVTGLDSALALKADLVDGKVPAAQLPGYVDDVLEYANLAAFPVTGDAGLIYVALDTNKTYRWSGSAYVEIGGGGVALGETSSTAYRGDRGKTAYDHSQSSGNPHNTGMGDIAGLNDAIAARLAATEVSVTPTADLVPRADGAGKIADGWLSNLIARLADLTWSNISGKPSTFPPATHTHTSTDISDLPEAVQDLVGAMLVAGTNVTILYNDATGEVTISAAGGGGGGSSFFGVNTATGTIAGGASALWGDIVVPANTLSQDGMSVCFYGRVKFTNNTGGTRSFSFGISVQTDVDSFSLQDTTANMATSALKREGIIQMRIVRSSSTAFIVSVYVYIGGLGAALPTSSGFTNTGGDFATAAQLVSYLYGEGALTSGDFTTKDLTFKFNGSNTSGAITQEWGPTWATV